MSCSGDDDDRAMAGGHCPIVWGVDLSDKKNNLLKYMVALDGHRSTMHHTTTNQKQAAATEGTMEGRHDEREAQGGAIPSFFEGAKFKGR